MREEFYGAVLRVSGIVQSTADVFRRQVCFVDGGRLCDAKIFDATSPIHAPEDAECGMRFVALELAQVVGKARGQHGNGMIGKGNMRHALGSVAVNVRIFGDECADIWNVYAKLCAPKEPAAV